MFSIYNYNKKEMDDISDKEIQKLLKEIPV